MSDEGTARGRQACPGAYQAAALAQTTPEQFYGLFPKPDVGGPERLWAAELGERTSLDTLVALEASK
jgi:hypothetical protein